MQMLKNIGLFINVLIFLFGLFVVLMPFLFSALIATERRPYLIIGGSLIAITGIIGSMQVIY